MRFRIWLGLIRVKPVRLRVCVGIGGGTSRNGGRKAAVNEGMTGGGKLVSINSGPRGVCDAGSLSLNK